MAAVTEATIEASRQEVFAVLVDPRTYQEWWRPATACRVVLPTCQARRPGLLAALATTPRGAMVRRSWHP